MISSPLLLPALVALFSSTVKAQYPVSAVVETNTFNSTFKLTPSQIARANLSADQASSVEVAVQNDLTALANGGPDTDTFYTLPSNLTSPTQPGVLLKSELVTNTTPFNIPPNTALSRLIYTSLDINNHTIPASAYILWPFAPRPFPNTSTSEAPVILWTHGTSGFYANGAPSANRALAYEYFAPFALALQGYAVVAPDYAGLGYNRNLSDPSARVSHQYLVSPASANDALYALRAARSTSSPFAKSLADKFVALGHSEGGGAAWSVAENVAANPALGPGYLGTVSVSPTTHAFNGSAALLAPFIASGAASVLPGFNQSEWLTPLGINRLAVYRETGGALPAAEVMFTQPGQTYQPDFADTESAKRYSAIANAGGKRVAGPLLVIHGTADPVIDFNLTVAAVQETCQKVPGADVAFWASRGTGHVPTLAATQMEWMGWIERRFLGVAETGGVCGRRKDIVSFLGIDRYQHEGNRVLSWTADSGFVYQAPFGP